MSEERIIGKGRVINLEQGTDAWLAWRMGGIGGSEVPILVAHAAMLLDDAVKRKHPIGAFRDKYVAALDIGKPIDTFKKTPWKFWAQKKGMLPREPFNAAMARGKKYESTVIDRFESEHDEILFSACLEHVDFPCIRASLDGLRPNRQPVEIKCPGTAVFEKMKKGIPGYYYPQVQQQIGCADADGAIFAFGLIDEATGNVDDYLEEPIARDQPFIDAMFALCQYFWSTYMELDQEPPLHTDDVVIREDPVWLDLATRWLTVKKAELALSTDIKLKKEAREKIEAEMKGSVDTDTAVQGGGVRYCAFTKQGNVDYKAAFAKLRPGTTEAELDVYRKKGSDQVRVTDLTGAKPETAPDSKTTAGKPKSSSSKSKKS